MILRLYRKHTIFALRSFLSSLCLRAPGTMVPKSMGIPSYLHHSSPSVPKIQPSFFFSGHHFATQPSYSQVDRGKNENNDEKIDHQIISRESIKPASPTPQDLRTFNLSIIDQFMYDIYTPMMLFFPNTDNTSVSDVVTKKSRSMKDSLSKLLTRYYPFAGVIVDDFHIECNDKGVYFVEARVNQTLEEFLRQPDDQKVRELIPKLPSTTESSLGNYITSVQVNIFNCGGIGLGMSLSHKLVDGQTYFTFMEAWAAATRGSSNMISPSFVASELFPYYPSLKNSLPSKFKSTKPLSTKRFVLDSKSLASLKSQPVASTHASFSSRGPTRTEATAALIWRAAAKTAPIVRPFSRQSPHALLSIVNLRSRASPPLPKESVGNIIDATIGICFPNKEPDLSTLMGEIRKSVAKINSDHIECLKGEKGQKKFDEQLGMINELSNVMDEGDCLSLTSLLNSSGMYELDFGWGKPIWLYHMNAGTSRIVSLNEVKKGGGVEAVVTLSFEEMEIFVRDPEILSYAVLDPSPLSLS